MSVLAKILGRQNKAPVPVPTPEWPTADGKIFVRRLSALERVEFHTAASAQKAIAGAAFQAFIVAFCAADEAGNRGFPDDAWRALQAEPCTVIDRIADAADDLNLLSSAARENLKKKSPAIPFSENTSDSQGKTESA